MSGAGNPMADQFAAVRGRAQAGPSGIDFLNQIAGGGGSPAAQSAPPAKPASGGAAAPAAAPPSATRVGASPSGQQQDVTTPFGLQVSNYFRDYAARQRNEDSAKLPTTGSMGGDYVAGITGAWDTLKKDFLASMPNAGAIKDHPLWDQLKDQFAREVKFGKVPLDAFNLALSPVTSAIGTAETAASQGAHKAIPGIGETQWKQVFDGITMAAPEAKVAGAAEGLADVGGAGSGPKPAPGAPAGASPAAPSAGAPPRAYDIAGDRPGADLKVTPELRQQAADFLAGKRNSPIDVHLDQLADPATRATAVNDIAKVIPKDGVKPIDVTQMGAYALNLTPQEVIESIRPKFASDEHWAGAVMAQNSAAEVFWNAARKAVDTRDPGDVEVATRAYAQFNEFTGALRDAKTDWGRAGRIQQEAAQYSSDFTRHIQSVVQDVGPDDVQQVIAKAALLPDPKQVSPFVASLRWMGSRDGMLYGWYNWLLSHAVIPKKIASDASLAALNIATRYTAEKFGLGNGAVAPGETAALIHGYAGSMSDAIRGAGKAFKAGQSQFHGDYQSLFDGHLLDRTSKLAAGAPEGFGPNETTRPALEYLRMALPTSAIAATDDFAKIATYRAEARTLLFRDGVSQGMDSDALTAHVNQSLDNVSPKIHEQAVSAALRNTLQEPLEGVAAQLQSGIDQMNIPVGKTGVEIPLGRILLPFTKVSVNALRFAYRTSPMPFVLPSPSWRAAMAQGGATRALAQAQAGLGTALSTLGILYYAGGGLTGAGPSSPDLRAAWLRAGNKPYHLTAFGTQVGYGHIEPLATTLGAIADTGDLMRYAKDEDNSQLAVSLALGTGHAMLNKTYLSTMSELLDAMQSPDSKGQRFAENFMAGLAVPGEMNMLARGLDPWLRAHNDLMSTIAGRTPGVSMSLPPQRDLWGAAIEREDGFPGTGMGRMLSPAPFAPAADAQPIDKWIWAHRADFPDGDQGRLGLVAPSGTLSVAAGGGQSLHVPLSLAQHDRLKVLAGNGLKDPTTGMGARDALNALAQGEYPNREIQAQWNRATPQRQALMVIGRWNAYRDGAKQQLLREDQGLRDTIGAARAGRAALLAPQVEGPP